MKNFKKDTLIFAIIFLIAIVVFHPYLLGHYASDTYNIVNQGYEKYAIEWNLKDGRILLAISVLMAELLNLPIEIYVFITLLMALIISCITIIKLKNIIEGYKPIKNLLIETVITSICFITIFNFMYVENLYFVECGMMALSILLYLIAADTLTKRNKNYFLKAMVYSAIGVFCYQGTIGFLFAMTVLLSFIKNTEKPYKETFKNLIFSGIIAIIVVILNLIQIKITCHVLGIEQTRLKGIESILNNFIVVSKSIPGLLIHTIELFPKWTLVMFTCSIFIITAFKLKQEKNIKAIVQLLLIVAITIASSFVIFLMTLSSFYTGRMHFCIGALIGIMLIFMYVKTEIFGGEKTVQYAIMVLITLYIITSIFSQMYVQYEHIKINKLEKQEVQQIYDYINEYENENHVEVTKIRGIYMKSNHNNVYYDWIKMKCPITHNAIKSTWAYDGVINFYTGKNLKTIRVTSEIMNKCADFLNEKDVEYKCIEDVLYIKVYLN